MPKGLLQFYQLCSLSKPPFDHLESEDIITADLLTTRCYALGYPCLLADPPCTGKPEGRHWPFLDPQTDTTLVWVNMESYHLAAHSQPGQGAEGKALGQFLQASPKILLCPPISELAFTPVLGYISNLMIHKEEKKNNLQPAEAAPPDYPLIFED